MQTLDHLFNLDIIKFKLYKYIYRKLKFHTEEVVIKKLYLWK